MIFTIVSLSVLVLRCRAFMPPFTAGLPFPSGLPFPTGLPDGPFPTGLIIPDAPSPTPSDPDAPYATGLILSPEVEALLDLPPFVLSGMDLHTRAGPIEVPASLNWTAEGKTNPVKNQGQCGSCWAFAAADAQASRHAVKNGELLNLSEQHMLDCSYPDRDGCLGGWSEHAWEMAQEGVAGKFYRDYNANGEETCPNESEFDGLNYKRVSWTGDDDNDLTIHQYFSDTPELKEDIFMYGPCVMYMGVETNFYGLNKDSGVWRCDPDVLINHAITVVGWGEQDGENYWLIKNSWGTGWGDEGFAKVSMDHCEIGSSTGVIFLCPEVRRDSSCAGLSDQSWNWNNWSGKGGHNINLVDSTKAAEISSNIKKGLKYNVDTDMTLRIQRDDSSANTYIQYIRTDTGDIELFQFKGGYADHTNVQLVNGGKALKCTGTSHGRNYVCHRLPVGQEVPVIITKIHLNPRKGKTWRGRWNRNKITLTGTKYTACLDDCSKYALTSSTHSSDVTGKCQSELGADWAIADWESLEALDLQSCLDTLQIPVTTNEKYYWVTFEGEEFWAGSTRHYFVERHNEDSSTGIMPDNWAEHDEMYNHLLTLGSWAETGQVLCKRS